MADGARTAPPDDLVQPFQIESMAAQGRLIRLGAAVCAVLDAHDYPDPVAELLAEALVIAAALAGALQFDGVLTLQAKGAGPVNILVVDITSDGAMRGYAQFDRAAVADTDTDWPRQQVPRLLGAGHLALTVDQEGITQRYQGIVALEGATLADCAHDYLRQSVQLDAVLKVAAARCAETGRWRAGGLMLQRLADKGAQHQSGDHDDAEGVWRRAVALLGSCTPGELVSPDLHPHDLLFRLFNQDGVRAFDSTALQMRCRCSRQRVENVLRSFPRAEIETMKDGDDVVVTCEFCNATYRFDPAAVEILYADAERDRKGESG